MSAANHLSASSTLLNQPLVTAPSRRAEAMTLECHGRSERDGWQLEREHLNTPASRDQVRNQENEDDQRGTWRPRRGEEQGVPWIRVECISKQESNVKMPTKQMLTTNYVNFFNMCIQNVLRSEWERAHSLNNRSHARNKMRVFSSPHLQKFSSDSYLCTMSKNWILLLDCDEQESL